MKTGTLQCRENWPLWSKVRMERYWAAFFSNGIGGRREDGSRVEASDCNMTVSAMLTVPLVYDAAAFRLYPASAADRPRFAELAKRVGITELGGPDGFKRHVEALVPDRAQGSMDLPKRIELSVAHRPLATPGSVRRPFYCEKEAAELVAFINGEELPCVEITKLRGGWAKFPGMKLKPGYTRYGPTEIIAWKAEVVEPDFEGMGLLGVLVGDLWHPAD